MTTPDKDKDTTTPGDDTNPYDRWGDAMCRGAEAAAKKIQESKSRPPDSPPQITDDSE